MATKTGTTHTIGARQAPESVRRSIRREIDDYADDIFLTEPEAAEACSVSPHTLKCWRLAHEDSKGPRSIKVYGMVRYRAADVRAWLEKMAEAV
jgi:predicted DNA-binding transcriptional regulator AlpA